MCMLSQAFYLNAMAVAEMTVVCCHAADHGPFHKTGMPVTVWTGPSKYTCFYAGSCRGCLCSGAIPEDAAVYVGTPSQCQHSKYATRSALHLHLECAAHFMRFALLHGVRWHFMPCLRLNRQVHCTTLLSTTGARMCSTQQSFNLNLLS